MLREKLQQQQQGGAGADGEVDEKTRSKLRDLEEAMKNTWEQKAQLSLQYEQVRISRLISIHGYIFIATVASMALFAANKVFGLMENQLNSLFLLVLSGAHGVAAGAAVCSAGAAGSQGAGLATAHRQGPDGRHTVLCS